MEGITGSPSKENWMVLVSTADVPSRNVTFTMASGRTPEAPLAGLAESTEGGTGTDVETTSNFTRST
jgi:hypothetical protein